MKTIAILNNIASESLRFPMPSIKEAGPAIVFIPDSAVANSGKPFFIPDFSSDFVATISPAIKINRLGKGISEKYAHRYFTEISFAVNIFSKTLLNQLSVNNMPIDRAVCYDKSLYIGKWLPFDHNTDFQASLLLNDEIVAKITLPEIGIYKLIEMISRDNTLKIGDIILPAVPFHGFSLKNKCDLNVLHSGEKILEIPIK